MAGLTYNWEGVACIVVNATIATLGRSGWICYYGISLGSQVGKGVDDFYPAVAYITPFSTMKAS